MKTVCVVYNHDRSWIRNDINLLRKHFDVYEFFYKRDKGKKDLKGMIKDIDVVFLWFASYHGLKAVKLAKKYNKKIVTVCGGYDVSSIKGYGLVGSFFTRWIPKYILKNSDTIIAFSKSAKQEIQQLVDKDVVVSFGVDSKSFYPLGKKDDIVLTVAYLDRVSWNRKGIDQFVELAKKFSNCGFSMKFVVVGKISTDVQERVNAVKLGNLVFTGYISDFDLLEYYQRAKLYIQLSKHEGFGSSVAEAMLCNCIPVVSNNGSLPEVVGDKGVVVNDGDDLFKVVSSSLTFEPNGQQEHVLSNFSLESREKVLLEILNGNDS